ncbi:MAG: hypothetical protein AAF610_08025 [Pseudomonadota bacterium]
MFRLLFLTAAISGTGAMAEPPTPLTVCAALDAECEQEGNMLVLGQTENSHELLDLMTVSARRFEARFGWSPQPTALVPGGVISATQARVLAEAGYEIQLPWLTAKDQKALRESELRKQVNAQTSGLPDTVREEAVRKALAAIAPNSNGDADSSEVHDGALAHELGHLWFMAMSGASVGGGAVAHDYGGAAPDWLDETFAVLMENAELRDRRRKGFHAMTDDERIPLERFFTMTHPAAKAAAELARLAADEEGPSDSRVVILTGDDADAFIAASGGDQTARFYSQVQVFSDYLLARAGDARFFVGLGEGLREYSGSMDAWLANRGAHHNLPASVALMQSDWLDWLQTR